MPPFCVRLYLPGLDFLRTFDGNLEDDIIYSDDDDVDDDDDYDDDPIYTRNAAHRPLEPHPRIRQLTDEVLHFFGSETKSSLHYLFLVCNVI